MQQLGRIIGDNLKRLRSEAGLSLDALAKASSVSKSRLGQIERGEANPSVTTVWQIANALRVEFSALVTSPRTDSVLVRCSAVEPVIADGGRYRAYPMFPFDPTLGYEVFLSELDPSGSLHAEPHLDGTWETVIMVSGELSVEVGGTDYSISRGEAIRFRADAPHEYRNHGDHPAVCHIVIAYPRTG